MDPTTFAWFLALALHGGGATCCGSQMQIAIPAIECKKTTPDDCTKISAYAICKAIGDANKNAAWSIECIAKPQ